MGPGRARRWATSLPQAMTNIAAELARALDEQREYLRAYEKPSQTLLFETLRSIDTLYMSELFRGSGGETEPRQTRFISSWGVNDALQRVMPRDLVEGEFHAHAPSKSHADQADDFLFGCGILHLVERLERQVRAGHLTGELRYLENRAVAARLLLLSPAVVSYGGEDIGLQNLKWASELARGRRLGQERRLAARFRQRLPDPRKSNARRDRSHQMIGDGRFDPSRRPLGECRPCRTCGAGAATAGLVARWDLRPAVA